MASPLQPSTSHRTREKKNVFVQRRYPRYDARVPIDLVDPTGRRVRWRAQSISLGGLYVPTDFSLPPGEPVNLQLDLPAGPVQARGRVAYVLTADAAEPSPRIEPGMGIRFEQIDPDQEPTLEHFLDDLDQRIRGRVLIVDDDRYYANTLREALREHDYSVSCVGSAGTALNILIYGEVDVVVSEQTLPRMDGLELVDSAISHRDVRTVGFVLLAREPMTPDQMRAAAQLGCSAVLRKPVDLETLLEAVELARADTDPGFKLR